MITKCRAAISVQFELVQISGLQKKKAETCNLGDKTFKCLQIYKPYQDITRLRSVLYKNVIKDK